MKIYNNINEFFSKKKTIVTLGTFDGFHVGHQQILKKIIEISEKNDLESVVLSFFPHPRYIISDDHVKLLNTITEKKELLNKLHVNHFIIHPFSKAFSELSPEEFVKNILIDQLNVSIVVIGHDHRFGKNRSANIDDLKLFGKKYNFEVLEISAQQIEEVNVSSTKIRNALQKGKVKLANDYLGYNYCFTGIIVKGNQLGRTIGFPTANFKIKEDYKMIPKNGVYHVQSIIDNKSYHGLMNIGYKPTIGDNELSIEVFYINLNQDLYNREIKVEILDFIRDEMKFDSVENLKNQIHNDLLYVQKIIS